MKKYVSNALHELQYPYSKRLQHATNKWESPNYGEENKSQGGNFIREPTRTEKNEYKKWWGNLYIISGKLTQCHYWKLDQSQQSKKKMKRIQMKNTPSR